MGLRTTHSRTTTSPTPRRVAWLAAALGAVLAGCGDENEVATGPTYPVKGSVQLAGGKPPAGSTVLFIPAKEGGRTAHARVEPDGTFALQTVGAGEGAAAGEYKVKVEPDYGAGAGRKGARRAPFPVKYMDEDASGLVVKVKPGTNQLDPFFLK